MNCQTFRLALAAATVFVAAGAFAAPARAAAPYRQAPPPPAAPARAPAAPKSVPVNVTVSTTAPTGEARIREWFDELTHASAAVRDRARVALMGIEPEELGVLRDVVDAARPVSPAQAAVLHDVVIHVYVAAGSSERSRAAVPRGGFLGVLLEPMQSSSGLGLPPPPVPPADDLADFGQLASSGGVLIKETWPGFAGFRFLRVGDVIIGAVRAEPAAREEIAPDGVAAPEGAAGGAAARAPSVQEFKSAVSSTPPGRTVELRVLRQGRVVDVPVRVSARPAWAEDEFTTRQMQSRRLMRAERYWRFAFALLLLDDGSMS